MRTVDDTVDGQFDRGTATVTDAAGGTPGDAAAAARPGRRELVGRSVLAVAVLAVVFGLALPRIADYGAAWAAVRTIGIGGAGLLLTVALVNLVAYWPPLVLALPGLRLREAAVVNQAGSAVSHTVPAGSAVAVGLTVHMLRSWGFTMPAIANQLLVTGVWNQLVKLGMPLVAVAVVAVTGELVGPAVRLAAWGAGGLVVVLVAAALVLRSEDGVRRLGAGLDGLVAPVLHRWHRRTDLATGLVRTREHVLEVVRTSGLRLSLATIASHVSLFTVLLVALRVVGVDADEVGWPAVLLAFALVRLLSAIPVTPGGAGLVELGYVALLAPGAGAGVAAEVAAGVLLFRAITYVLPILLGGFSWVVFRSADSWRRPVGTRTPAPAGTVRAPGSGTVAPPAPSSLVQSPIHAAQLVAGVVVTAVGWGAATLFTETLVAATRDLAVALAALPPALAVTPGLVATAAAPAVLVAVAAWALTTQHTRLLALATLAGGLAVGLSFLAAGLLETVLQPAHQALYAGVAWWAGRSLPTDPSVAGLLAVLAIVQPSLPHRTRRVGRWLIPLWLLATFAAAHGAPHLGVLVDAGLGLLAAGLVGVLLRSASVQPGEARIAAGLAASGLDVTRLERAHVDARGSVPWRGQTATGPVFIKVLSREQRLADVLFRGLRWLRLRRTGDAPPESSLRRAAEHEAFLSHHVRGLSVPTPRVRTVVGLGDEDVALVVDWVAGHSLDRVPVEDITDDVLRAAWTHVRTLRRHGVAHRDLRLANVFLAPDDGVLLIDFSFAELTASRQLLDTDVAELLAATAGVVGVDRAVAAAAAVLGPDVLADASAWLAPAVLSTETRLVARRTGVLEPLRARVEQVGGLPVHTRPPLTRLHPRRVVGALLVVLGLYAALAALVDGAAGDRLLRVHWDRAAAAAGTGLLWYLAAGAAYRSAAASRVPLRIAAAAVLVGRLPLPDATTWSRASEVLAHVRDQAVVPFRTRREASGRWVAVGMAVAPALVGGFVGAVVRQSSGTVDGIVAGVGAGLLLAVVQLLGLRLTSWGRELQRVWLPAEALGPTDQWRVSPVVGWWTVAWTLLGISHVLAARAVGVEEGVWGLLAVAIAADALSRLAPSPGGIGAAELLLFGGLLFVVPPDAVAVVVIVARLVTYWLHLPAAFLLRDHVAHHTRRSRHAGP